ncbi:MAG: YitT family protein [Chitinophagales bacterium]|nr:YitT family protein [Chitinophagales bacterium]MDW8393772.1 YitT family protein [Chitinophagales bacterium]
MSRNRSHPFRRLLVNNYLVQVLDSLILRRTGSGRVLSPYAAAKQFRLVAHYLRSEIRNTLLIALGILSASIGLKSFLIPNGFIDGGITGVSLMTARLSGIPLPWWLLLYNLPFMILGFSQINRNFAVKSMLSVTGLSLAVGVLDFPTITSDKLLIAVFGGFFLGLGIGLAVRGGSVLDGTEVLAIYVGRRTGITVGDFLLITNIIIFSTAAALLGVEVALYSILIYLAAGRTVDFVLEGIEEYTGVTIISTHSDKIREMIIRKMGRGVTVYQGKVGYGRRGTQRQNEILFTVITRLEVARLYSEIDLIDPNAFVVMSSIKDTRGGMVKKRAHKLTS